MTRRKIYLWINLGYSASIAAWLIARALYWDHSWALAVINTMAVYLFGPLPILFFLGLVLDHPRKLLTLALPCIAFLVIYGELFLPRMSAESELEGQRLRVMTFNVDFRNNDMRAVAEAVRAVSPDILGLQEYTPSHDHDLGRLLESDYPYRTRPKVAELHRVGLFSRYPIQSTRALDLPPRHQAVRAEMDIAGRRIQIYVAHLSPTIIIRAFNEQGPIYISESYARREDEAVRLNQSISNMNEPVLLLCDCNLTDTSEAYHHLDAVLEDSFRQAGWGLGHTVQPVGFPFHIQRIDFIWYSPAFEVTWAETGPEGASDHLPVVAELILISKP